MVPLLSEVFGISVTAGFWGGETCTGISADLLRISAPQAVTTAVPASIKIASFLEVAFIVVFPGKDDSYSDTY
jgi:hypothetical protein